MKTTTKDFIAAFIFMLYTCRTRQQWEQLLTAQCPLQQNAVVLILLFVFIREAGDCNNNKALLRSNARYGKITYRLGFCFLAKVHIRLWGNLDDFVPCPVWQRSRCLASCHLEVLVAMKVCLATRLRAGTWSQSSRRPWWCCVIPGV